ncbi:TIGR04388 family protein [Leptospira sanjuanensis]|uniref:TIGR04388 family protein n=1 Tax=Leptospira sanjuanensis TaxID=2879643 RepID=UPI003873A140
MNKAGGKSWANGSVNVSASREGHSSLALSYNHDGNTAIPQRLRGGGATLDLGNDGVLGFSIQGLKGATIGTVSYNTNSHGWEQATLNQNFQNEYLQGVTAENSSYNHEKSQMEILRTELSIATKMEKPLFTQADVDKYLPKNKDGSIDVENAQPEKLLEKWNAHKEAMSQTPEGLQKWKDDVTRAGERSGIEIRFNDGKSATSTFGKFVTGMFGDIAQSFGIANDGSKMVDKQGVFHLDTCFRGDVPVLRLKHKENGIYGNVKSPEFSSEDYELIAIEEVKIGDVVQSWNERTGKLENKRVTETFVHEVPQLFFLELDGEDEIHTTWNHPFRRRIVTQNGSNASTNQNRVSPFDPSGIQRTYKTHEHLLHPREARIVTSLLGSGSESETKTASVIEELPHSTDSNHSASDVTLSKTERFSSNTTTQTSEWVKVEDLRLRDQVLKADGSWGTVTGIYYYNTEPTKVYNLEVEENHTYVVGGRESNSGAGYVVHNYTEQVQRVLDGNGILSEDNTKIVKSANSKDKIRALGEIKEFDYAGSKWKNVGSDENGVVHFQSESNKYGLKEDLFFKNKNGKVEIEQIQHLNGKDYLTKSSSLDVLKQTVIGVNFKSTNEYLNHLTNVLGERGGSGTKYDDGTPKVSLRKDVTGQPILHETKNGTHTVEIERNGHKGKMVVEEVGRTQREAQSSYPGERGLVRAYDRSNPNEYKAWDWQNDKYGDGKGGDLRDSAVCQSTVIAEDRHNNGKTVGEVAKHMGDFAVALGKRPSQLEVSEISQALKKDGLKVGADIYMKESQTRAQFNDKFFEFAKRQLDQGMAVNVGGKYANSIGHVTRIVGYVEGPHGERGFMINDSYGDANKGYTSGAGGQDGRAVFYPIDKLNVAQFNYAYTIVEDTGANTPSGSSSSGSRRRSSSGGFWNKFSNIFKFDFFKKD